MSAAQQTITKVIVPSLETSLARSMRSKLQSCMGGVLVGGPSTATRSPPQSVLALHAEPSFMKVSFPRKPIQYC